MACHVVLQMTTATAKSCHVGSLVGVVTSKGQRCLHTRTDAQTVADTLAWYRGLPADQQAFTKAGLSPEREAAALERLLRR